ncbi:MAG: SUMF1/EgtB/PvdO family nonheme iron enzyme, partial [Calditrichaeota bacterium]|nr:SUMF1/EgtB/PvdO family nonheme iron enzyme [Calditrichota bacterium]
MEKLIQALIDLMPFADWLERMGLNLNASVALATVINAALVYGILKLSKHLINRYKNSRVARDLAPYFDYQKVKSARDLFIPTQFQNQSPTREDEPAFSHKFVSKNPLIPFFMKTAFDEKKESDKFYLILADSGMGKTTFMINLYVKYTSFFNFRRKYQIRLYPFGDSRILGQIKEIKPEEARNTILLLDAFDEDKQLIPSEVPDGLSEDERFRRRLDEIIEAVRDFREVVITSRTQYFPGQEQQPYELKIPRFDEKGFHTLAKLYLSPFDRREIKRYLRKKYGFLRFWNRKKKRIATNIVDSSPMLMVRPMLLSYIDYLVGEEQEFKNTYQIYQTLIDRWIDREATKRRHKHGVREKFKQHLKQYSRLVALEIYRRRKAADMLYLEKDVALAVAAQHQIDLQGYEITGQSLLTRDASGNWKFAHKSILEYLIAREALDNFSFLREIDFSGMDMAQQFCREIVPEFVWISGGNFIMGSPDDEVDRNESETQHEVKISDFFIAKYLVTAAQFETFIMESNYRTDADKAGGSFIWSGKKWHLRKGVNWRCDVTGKEQKDKQNPVIHVSWNDAIEYCHWLSKKLGVLVRLPTEAEWEYACRAGTATPFNTGETLSTEQANYDGNSPYNNGPKGVYLQKTTPVGSY